MLRGLKKIRKSITEAQKSRSSGSHNSNNHDQDCDLEDNDLLYQAHFYRSSSEPFPDGTATTTTTTTSSSSTTTTAANHNSVSTGTTVTTKLNLHQHNSKNTTTATAGGRTARKSSSVPTTSSTYRKKGGSMMMMMVLDKQALLAKSTHLSSFDKCIEASDAMIASSYSSPNNKNHNSNNNSNSINNNNNDTEANQHQHHRHHVETIFAVRSDPQTGLPDCSLLVSPDGDLLLVPNESSHMTSMFQPNKVIRANTTTTTTMSTKEEEEEEEEDVEENEEEEDVGLNRDGATRQESIHPSHTSLSSSSFSGGGNFSELMRQSQEDYESAMFIGNDLHGDKVINRFSAKGWSVPATTLAVEQTEFALESMARFCEQYVLTRKESAAKMTIACDQWRSDLDQRRGFQTNRNMTGEQWEILDPRATSFDLSPSRVGPFTSHGSTISAAAMAIEQYHHEAAEKESNRWRLATLKRDGALSTIQASIDTYRTRSTKRQQALAEMSHRAQIVEEHIRKLKQISEQKWDAVYKAEQRVTLRMEELMTERSKERQKARLKLLLREQQQQENVGVNHATVNHPTTSTDDVQLTCNLSDEVWDMVSSVAESMEHGSFEPIPDAASTISDEASSVGGGAQQQQQITDRDEVLVSHPIVTREEIEQEMGVPELRAAARQVDDELQDESGTLLNIISLLDTTRRSARIAAETCLVSAGNAQATCLRNILQLERESLQERLRDLDGLEQVLDKMDVRADLDTYIVSDKKELGGCSHLGDDDDGGIASALAVLSSHVDGIIMGQESGLNAVAGSTHLSRQRTISSEPVSGVESEEKEEVTTSVLNSALDHVFRVHSSLGVDDPSVLDQEAMQYYTEFDKNLEFLCETIAGNTTSAQNRRSALCYLLNSKRGTFAQIPTMKQYHAISKIFATVLTNGLDDEEVGISNAKMCMMLAQTFYFLNDSILSQPEQPVADATNADDVGNHNDELNQSLTRAGRQYRIYIKNALTSHPIWSNDDFWDIALSQQISESLTHSGVMSNFEARRSIKSRASRLKSHEKSHVTQWYDLNYTERVEAASQVHAVVFAQLGALAHSMIEFDCGLERSCAFVRRMSIRNQLPSSQRTMLLLHLMDRDDVGRRESKLHG